MTKKIRVVGYDRVSSPAQVKSGTSLESQREAIENYVEGLPNHKLVNFYEDAGVSGKNTKRPELQRMIEDAKNGKFDKVCFWKMQRFGRNAKDTLNNFELFEEELGIGLVSVEEHFDTSKGYGKLIITVLAAVAEFDNSQRAEASVIGKRARLKQGRDGSAAGCGP